MLAMGEVVALAQENFFWDFPNLGPKEDINCQEKYAKMNNNNDDDDCDGDCGGGGGDSEEVVAVAAPPNKGRRKKKRDKNDKEMTCDEHELHIWTERERRKKMRSMFANLHALLPHLPPKADKTTIVDEAVNHIKKLQVAVEELKNKKLQRLHGPALTIQSREAFLADQSSPVALPPAHRLDFPPFFKTWTSPNMILSLCGNDAHISVCSLKKPGLLHAICFAMEKHKLDILSAQISSDWNRCMYIFHARANVGSERLIQTFPVEAIYKQAAAEILLWINS